MRLVRERHDAGATAGAGTIGQHLLVPVDERQTQVAAIQPRGAARADDVQPFRTAGIGGDCGDDRARRAGAETHQCRCVVLGLHSVQRRGAHLRRRDGFNAKQPAEQIERMDRLGDQHTAAVARLNAAARLVVVRLRPPPRHEHRRRLDIPEHPGSQRLMQTLTARTEAMLEADAEAAIGATPRRDQLFAAFDRNLQRLLAQHVLAGGKRRFGDRQMRVRRRQHHHCIDRRIRNGARDIGGGGKSITVGNVLQSRFAARRGPHHADLVGEIDQGARVRLQRVAEAYDGDADHGRLAV